MKNAALVCSGGEALGMAHLGVIEVLEKSGYRFDWYAGVSAGSIMTSMHAMGLSVDEIVQTITELDFASLAFDFTRKKFGLIAGKKFTAQLDKIFRGKSFSDLSVPLQIGTTDFQTGERIILQSGKISDAVRASCSIPLMFHPHWHEGEKRWLVDGGLTQNFPLDLALSEYKGKKIFGSDVGSAFDPDVDFTETSRGIRKKSAETIFRTIKIMMKSQQKFSDDPRVTVFRPPVYDFRALEIRKAKLRAIYECGRKYAEEFLREVG